MAHGQSDDVEAEIEAEYNRNIKKSRIAGVYIPKDFEDAFVELRRLSSAEDLRKFKSQPEEEVCRRLHFGLGRWMMVNWSFYAGSRYSHFLRQQGVTYPDDMAHLTLRLFHRHLNEKPLDVDNMIKEVLESRQMKIDEMKKDEEVLDSFRRKRQE
jgi:hypothetical protein